jgi:hypothetical protein
MNPWICYGTNHACAWYHHPSSDVSGEWPLIKHEYKTGLYFVVHKNEAITTHRTMIGAMVVAWFLYKFVIS